MSIVRADKLIYGAICAIVGVFVIVYPESFGNFFRNLSFVNGGSGEPNVAIDKILAAVAGVAGLVFVLVGSTVAFREIFPKRKRSKPKSSQVPSSGAVAYPGDSPKAVPSPAPRVSKVGPRIEDIIARHDGLLTEWRDHTNDDIDLVFAHPFLSEISEPLVIDHLKAMEVARDLRPDDPKKFRGPVTGSEYANAVFDLRVKWQVALRRATQLRDSAVPAADQKILREAKALWAVVSAESATMSERASAAKSLASKLERLGLAQSADNSRVFAEIEAIQRKALTVGEV